MITGHSHGWKSPCFSSMSLRFHQGVDQVAGTMVLGFCIQYMAVGAASFDSLGNRRCTYSLESEQVCNQLVGSKDHAFSRGNVIC